MSRADLRPAARKPMNPNLRRLRRAAARLVRAEIAEQWRGAGDPSDYAAIKAELKAARANFATISEEVTA